MTKGTVITPTADIEDPTIEDLEGRDKLIVVLLSGNIQTLDQMVGIVDLANKIADKVEDPATRKHLKNQLRDVPKKINQAKQALLEQHEAFGYLPDL